MVSPYILSGIIFATVLVVTASAHEAVNPLTNDHTQQHHHHAQHPTGGQQPQHHQGSQQHEGQQGHKAHMMGKDVVQDQEHIMEHLDGKINKPEETMSEEELQFHYFKVHDYDDNNMLDGLEILSALTHQHADGNKDGERTTRMPDSELSQTIDSILKENDPNRDGFIDYTEFVLAQRMAAKDQT